MSDKDVLSEILKTLIIMNNKIYKKNDAIFFVVLYYYNIYYYNIYYKIYIYFTTPLPNKLQHNVTY